ncbi:alpha/beta hydrolase [Aliikangiella marina]|uniref:Alpha/beta hydrolase n=1 Tax=Aliikangiella marina TaxID=1712262 RepID=A0A545T7C7_9GAMM|nr:alpha/beta hydrolase [Aliikangiella marina]TQV73127.1 alpha/beta hydrolase [Aliikangiella marina]
MQFIIKILSIIAPGWVVKKAIHTINNPKVKKLREHETEVIQQAKEKTIKFNDFDIKTYRWGSGTKSILLVHGWEGQAGNFAEIIDALVDNDYTVYAFDAPSHGFSSSGETSVFEFSELTAKMLQDTGVKEIISHSFGGVATTIALSQNPAIAIDKYLLLTTPDKFVDRIDTVAQQVGISEKIKARLIKTIEAHYQLDVTQTNVSAYAPKTNVKSAKIIHDIDDKVVPIEYSRNVCAHWPVCTLEEISGTGHFRILRTPEVIEKIITFFKH